MKRNKEELAISQVHTTLPAFLEIYNRNIPQGFPRATAALLKEFQAAHPTLFKHGDTWSVDQHRKRVIDWLSSHRDSA